MLRPSAEPRPPLRTERCVSARDAAGALEDALAELDRRARSAAPGGYPEVQARLAAAHPGVADYLSAYQRIWDDCQAASNRADLVTWPASPIRYVPIPPQTRDAAPFLYYLFYRSPAPFDRLPVHDYVVTPVDEDMAPEEQQRRLRAANTSVIKLNHVVHHGAIGHHVQNHYAYAGASEIGRIAAVDCASRIGMFLGGTMAEGWACYATDLMDEIGFLTPDESLAQQHTRARLAARAVVDLGLHAGSMTFDEAVGVYRDRVGMSPEAAHGEACKNAMFPATAIMYWLGTEGLHRLRRSRRAGRRPLVLAAALSRSGAVIRLHSDAVAGRRMVTARRGAACGAAILALVAAAPAAAGCRGRSATTAPSNDRLIVGYDREPDTLNRFSTHILEDIQTCIVEGLTTTDEQMRVVPLLATDVPTRREPGCDAPRRRRHGRHLEAASRREVARRHTVHVG